VLETDNNVLNLRSMGRIQCDAFQRPLHQQILAHVLRGMQI